MLKKAMYCIAVVRYLFQAITGRVRIVRLTTRGIDLLDDPSLPFKLEVMFRAPKLMTFAFVARFGGSEQLVVQSATMWGLRLFIWRNGFRGHPRLSSGTITGPSGVVERFASKSSPISVSV